MQLDKEGYAKLADFGLARVLDQEQLASTVAGTPWYVHGWQQWPAIIQ